MLSQAKSRPAGTHDPVCGMKIDEPKATAKSEYQGDAYYFCSPSCKAAFDKEPSKYAKPTAEGESRQGQNDSRERHNQ